MSVELHLEPGRLARMLRMRNGIVERRLAARTRRVAAIARAEAPGSMGRHIDWHIREGPRGLEAVITCSHPAVHWVLRGTRPHLIKPRRPKGVLRFEVDGQVVYAKYARHPGTRANDFLGRALRLGR
ncbi:hypothetical protein ACFY0A_37455 [Streptomyces sp. NPDC001698]|uniref:hypothetical protein n=1 Tax=Streptomyces sp. NPDC001698 TaxID=3364601 RepID=UPI003675ED33